MAEAIHESKTRLLAAALRVIRAKGYAATRIEDVCEAAGLTKGSFFHHFKGKEELAVAAAEYWSATTGGVFDQAPYRVVADPLERLLAYVDFRRSLLRGRPCEFTCLAGTMVQEVFDTYPAIREACDQSIRGHAADVAKDIEAARRLYAPQATWSAESLALYTQAVLQGAFVLAKAHGGPEVAVDCLDHLESYLRLLFGRNNPKERT